MRDRYSNSRRARVEAAVRGVLGGHPDDSCVVVIQTRDGYFTAGGHAFGDGLSGVARLAALGAEHIANEIAAGHDGSEEANLTADQRQSAHDAAVRSDERMRIVAYLRRQSIDALGPERREYARELAEAIEALP